MSVVTEKSFEHIDLNELSEKAENLLFLSQIIKDVCDEVKTGKMSLQSDVFLAMQELNVEALDISEQLAVWFSSTYLESGQRDEMDLTALRLWVHGFASFSEEFDKPQRLMAFERLVKKGIKTPSQKINDLPYTASSNHH